jgi:hypothetical protein
MPETIKIAKFPSQSEIRNLIDFKNRSQLSIARSMSLKDKRTCFMQMRKLQGDVNPSLIYSALGLPIGTIAVAHVMTEKDMDINLG